MGRGGRFPNLTGKQMRKVLERICGAPIKKPGGGKRGKGSHSHYVNPDNGKKLMFSYHDQASVNGGIVRQMLTRDLGLTLEEARRALT